MTSEEELRAAAAAAKGLQPAKVRSLGLGGPTGGAPPESEPAEVGGPMGGAEERPALAAEVNSVLDKVGKPGLASDLEVGEAWARLTPGGQGSTVSPWWSALLRTVAWGVLSAEGLEERAREWWGKVRVQLEPPTQEPPGSRVTVDEGGDAVGGVRP